MNMRKFLAMLASAMMLFSVMPLGALSVSAAVGDVAFNKDFDDGTNGGFDRSVNEDGYIAFDATTADWQNTYAYANGIKANTLYNVSFKAKASKDAALTFKLNNNWAGDTFKKTDLALTTEWANIEFVMDSGDLTGTALVMFCSPYAAADAPTYYFDDVKIVETVDPELIGKVVNGDFENGSESWTLGAAASIIDDGGNSVLQLDNPNQWAEAALQIVSVEQDTTYTLTWKSKRVSGSGAFNLYLLNGDNVNYAVTGHNWMNSTSTDWVEHSVKISTGTYNVLKLKFSTEASAPGVIYIDDVALKADPKPVVGQITNGDFENGDLIGWDKYQSTAISADAAYEGSYGAHLQGNGGWGGMLSQTISVEAGKTYELSFWIKAVTSGVNIQIKDANNDGTSLTNGGWFTGTEWTQRVYTFTAISDNVYLNFCGGGTGNAESVYLDNVSLVELKDPSFDGYIYNGDFETGKASPWVLYQSSAISADAAYSGEYGLILSGNGASWGGTAYQDFTVESGKTYVIWFQAKALSNGVNVQIQQNGSNLKSTYISNTSWKAYSLEVASTGTTMRLNTCCSGITGTDTVYLDNVLVFEKVEQSNDGYIINGTFETGALSPWENLWGSCPKAEVVKGGKDSNFAVEIISGQWKHVRQTNIAVEANTDYKITAWAKNAQGMSLLVKDGGDSKDIVNTGIEAGDEWTEFVIEFNSGEYTSIIFSLMGNNADAAFGTFDNIVMEKVVCEHEYDDCMDADCNLCGETREPGHNLTHTPAVVPANCSETGNQEYWYCDACDAYFGDAEASYQLNPAWITYTGDHVRPEGAADCATVACELCGTELVGSGAHDTGVPVCQDGHCSKCDQDIAGYGCANYDTPICEDGACTYCGEFIAGVGHENGAIAPCLEGECSYGCGLKYPATEDHVDADADDYCDNCWSHLACVDEDADGFCDVCWSEMPAEEILYGDANGDGAIDALDEVLLSQYLAEWDVEVNEAAADANGDGSVDALDEVLLSQYLAEWDVVLGPQG